MSAALTAAISSFGALPTIAATVVTVIGLSLLWCRAGTSVDDFISARAVLTAACWAQDVAIFVDTRHPKLVTLDIVRRSAYVALGFIQHNFAKGLASRRGSEPSVPLKLRRLAAGLADIIICLRGVLAG